MMTSMTPRLTCDEGRRRRQVMTTSVTSRSEIGKVDGKLVEAGNMASSSKSSGDRLQVHTASSLVPPWCRASSGKLTAGT